MNGSVTKRGPRYRRFPESAAPYRVVAAHLDRQTAQEFDLLAQERGESKSALLRKLIAREVASVATIGTEPGAQ
jgi:hypothetical protein